MDIARAGSALTLLSFVEARAALSGEALRLRVVRPPFPAAGTGTLRVLRVREREGVVEIAAGYDGYVRLGTRAS